LEKRGAARTKENDCPEKVTRVLKGERKNKCLNIGGRGGKCLEKKFRIVGENTGKKKRRYLSQKKEGEEWKEKTIPKVEKKKTKRGKDSSMSTSAKKTIRRTL